MRADCSAFEGFSELSQRCVELTIDLPIVEILYQDIDEDEAGDVTLMVRASCCLV